MSNALNEKIVLIRKSEYLSRQQLADLTGIPYGTLSYYESGRSTPPTDVMMKILQVPQFTKYTLWFMTDQVSPEAGQIAPALAHFGQDLTTSQHSDQKTG
ncbi:helix-turn-helix transcriptional regulator [Klebsiella pneumoniae]|uniref:helix-turn-helix domain-containing protein n=1 Tax=Klebsiella pneumoniae TaxID=573 RepID=UPI00143562A1|nr:helix-turn-helix transcriptional regulator [Klebsiella pneumoniae]MBX4641223.1 transcriptional regulator [Klebsiella pneumoniae]QIV50970.1 helix-turn-helix transcriptional regulator [Klebsiella pneumoniae]HBR4728559.1 helix-turn-helix transcriptional regulator [Klebsiella pneumoniae]